jgi:hypothetical protein
MSLEIDIGVATLSDYDEDDHLQIQTDSPGLDDTAGTQPAEALSPNGVHSRPLDPDKDSKQVGLGEGVLMITIGDRRYALPIGDPRDVAAGRVPKLKKGGKQLVGGAGDYRSFINIDGEDPTGAKVPGSVMISASYSKGGAKKSLGLSFNVRDSGTEDISLVHGEGARITLNSTGTTIAAPNGKHYLEVSNDGITLAGDIRGQGSFTAGAQLAAMPVVKGPELTVFLSALITLLTTTPAVPASPLCPPAAALAAMLPALLTNHLKST